MSFGYIGNTANDGCFNTMKHHLYRLRTALQDFPHISKGTRDTKIGALINLWSGFEQEIRRCTENICATADIEK